MEPALWPAITIAVRARWLNGAHSVRSDKPARPIGPMKRSGLSQVTKRLGTYPPTAGRRWEAWEDDAVRTLSPADAEKKTGRTRSAVMNRRHVLGVPDGRTKRQRRRFGRMWCARTATAAAWPTLSLAIRAAVMALVNASGSPASR